VPKRATFEERQTSEREAVNALIGTFEQETADEQNLAHAGQKKGDNNSVNDLNSAERIGTHEEIQQERAIGQNKKKGLQNEKRKAFYITDEVYGMILIGAAQARMSTSAYVNQVLLNALQEKE